ncbi:carotenoid biosynthesis protein [Bacteroidota bacterium]
MLRSNTKMEAKTFYMLLIIIFVTVSLMVLFLKTEKSFPLGFIVFSSLAYFIFTLFNAEAVMGLKNALTLKLIAFIFTFTGEVIGVNYGWIFGSYDYSSLLGIKILGVPILIILLWDVFIYTSYMLVTHSFNFRFTKTMPKKLKLWYSFLVAALTGIATMSLDLIIDPVAIVSEWWIWEFGGSYFPSIENGVPINNFLGWAVLTFLSIFVFKYFFEKPYKEKETIFEYSSVLPYFIMFISYITIAIVYGLKGPAMVGGFAMSTFIVLFLLGKTLRKFPLPKEFD